MVSDPEALRETLLRRLVVLPLSLGTRAARRSLGWSLVSGLCLLVVSALCLVMRSTAGAHAFGRGNVSNLVEIGVERGGTSLRPLPWLLADMIRELQPYSGSVMRADMSLPLEDGELNETVPVAAVTPSWFEFYGLRAYRGLASLGTARPGEPPEPYAIVSHWYWQSQYGGDFSVLGRDVRLGAHWVRVVGIAAPRAEDLPGAARVAFWVPVGLPLAGQGALQTSEVEMVSRLEENASISGLNFRLDVLNREYRDFLGGGILRARRYVAPALGAIDEGFGSRLEPAATLTASVLIALAALLPLIDFVVARRQRERAAATAHVLGGGLLDAIVLASLAPVLAAVTVVALAAVLAGSIVGRALNVPLLAGDVTMLATFVATGALLGPVWLVGRLHRGQNELVTGYMRDRPAGMAVLLSALVALSMYGIAAGIESARMARGLRGQVGIGVDRESAAPVRLQPGIGWRDVETIVSAIAGADSLWYLTTEVPGLAATGATQVVWQGAGASASDVLARGVSASRIEQLVGAVAAVPAREGLAEQRPVWVSRRLADELFGTVPPAGLEVSWPGGGGRVAGVVESDDGRSSRVIWYPIATDQTRDAFLVLARTALTDSARATIGRLEGLAVGQFRDLTALAARLGHTARAVLSVAFAAVILCTLVCIGCTWVGVLAVADSRRSEVATRMILGARRSDIARWLARPIMAIGVAGLAAGVAGVVAGTRLAGAAASGGAASLGIRVALLVSIGAILLGATLGVRNVCVRVERTGLTRV